ATAPWSQSRSARNSFSSAANTGSSRQAARTSLRRRSRSAASVGFGLIAFSRSLGEQFAQPLEAAKEKTGDCLLAALHPPANLGQGVSLQVVQPHGGALVLG